MPETRAPQSSRHVVLWLMIPVLVALCPVVPAAAEPTDTVVSGDDNFAIDNPLDEKKAALALVALDERAAFVSDLILEVSRAYRKVAIERGSAQQELQDALERLDREAIRSRDLTRERLDQVSQDVDRARLRLAQLLEETRRRLDDLRLLVLERDQLGRRIAVLRSRLPATKEVLTGVWEVTFLPANVSGTFYLDQSGTLVTGQYRLGTLGTGSLQGTFVNGKLLLQRIDAQRGRDAEIEGVLDPDGMRLRGTWQNYEMVQGGIPRGQWVARRAR